jgi:predicted ribosome quality control (RQC) complex YloA/Tae2 family protein
MHFDALTLACVAHELREELTGGRVQQVVLPDAHSVGFEIYAQRQRRYLFASAEPNAGRIHMVSQKLRRGVEQETPLLLLLRKYVRDSILDAIEQPDPTERILHLVFDHPGYGVTTLVTFLIVLTVCDPANMRCVS